MFLLTIAPASEVVQSCFSVLDLEQQGLSDDALKVVLDLIFRPAQPREVEKKNLKLPFFI